MRTVKELESLLQKYNEGNCTEEEVRVLEVWLSAIAQERNSELPDQETIARIFDRIKNDSRFLDVPVRRLSSNRRYWRAAVASFVGVLLVGTAIYLNHSPSRTQNEVAAIATTEKKDLAPGTNKATLTLSNGEVIDLDHAKQEHEASNDLEGAQLTDGAVQYAHGGVASKASEMEYHTLTTPKGGQYHLILPDGTKAWLNAASSITYPVQFSATERLVKISGEVYFEVAKQNGKAFLVESGPQRIKVLGTQFNVNAYKDERAIQTTLLEGSVEIALAHVKSKIRLVPGQEASATDKLTVAQVDPNIAVAWKNGDFYFKDESLGSILRKVARWYDAEIECPAKLESLKFSGVVSREKPLSAVVKMIQSTENVKIKLRERRIIVTE